MIPVLIAQKMVIVTTNPHSGVKPLIKLMLKIKHATSVMANIFALVMQLDINVMVKTALFNKKLVAQHASLFVKMDH